MGPSEPRSRVVDAPESVPPASPEKSEPAQCCAQWAPLPSPAAHWPVSPQEDVLNTQCGYDVRLKLVSREGQGPGSWGHWDGKGSCSISSSGEGVPSPKNHPGTQASVLPHMGQWAHGHGHGCVCSFQLFAEHHWVLGSALDLAFMLL